MTFFSRNKKESVGVVCCVWRILWIIGSGIINPPQREDVQVKNQGRNHPSKEASARPRVTQILLLSNERKSENSAARTNFLTTCKVCHCENAVSRPIPAQPAPLRLVPSTRPTRFALHPSPSQTAAPPPHPVSPSPVQYPPLLCPTDPYPPFPNPTRPCRNPQTPPARSSPAYLDGLTLAPCPSPIPFTPRTPQPPLRPLPLVPIRTCDS